MKSLFSFLEEVKSDQLEEIAVVPCGGCEKGQLRPADLRSFKHCSTALSLPSLLASSPISLRRLEHAHAVVGISACDQACTASAIQFVRPLDAHIITTQSTAPNWLQELGKTLDSLRKKTQTELYAAPKEAFDGSFDQQLPAPIDTAEEDVEVLDYCGLVCPMPIVSLSKATRERNHGTFEVLADDRAFPADIEAWCHQKGATLVGIEKEGKVFRATLTLPSPASQHSLPSVSTQAPLFQQRPATVLPTPQQAIESLPVLAELDCMQLRSPLQIVELQKALNQFHRPGKLIVYTQDPRFVDDVQHWCEQSGNHLLSLEQGAQGIRAVLAIHPQQIGSTAPPANNLGFLTQPQPASMYQATLNQFSSSQPPPPLTMAPPTQEPLAPPPQSMAPQVAPPQNATESLDYTGLRCPMPIIELSKAVKASSATTFQVQADDAAFLQDLKAWCKQHQFVLLESSKKGRLTTATISSSHTTTSPPLMFHTPPRTAARQAPTGAGSALLSMPLSTRQTGQLQHLPPHLVDFPSQSDLPSPNPAPAPLPPLVKPKAKPKTAQRETMHFDMPSAPISLDSFFPSEDDESDHYTPTETGTVPQNPVELDLRGLKCPMPIIKLAAAIREKPNELYFVIADDPAFPPDLRAWCAQQNIKLLNLDSQGGTHRGLFQAKSAVALRNVSHTEAASTATAIPTVPVQLTPASASEFPLEAPSEELNLFEEMQDLDYWPTEIPTAPTPAIDLRGLSKIDCRTMSTKETIAQLEEINAHDKGVILHVQLASNAELNAIEEWCRSNKVTCIANNQTSEQREIWLQPEPTTNEEGPQP